MAASQTPGLGGTRAVSKSKYTYVPKDVYEMKQKEYQANLKRAVDHNLYIARVRSTCINVSNNSCLGNAILDLPAELDIRPAGDPAEPAAPAAPVVTPQQAAYIASARLKLTAPRPMIGPSPSINPWKMAAVGYPMWLWAEGNLNPAPVTDTVYDLSVSLDARLVKVVYGMGDGHKVTCTNVGHAWTRSVAAAAPSPSCGYTYQQPSLPKGDYTITANAVWAVDWTINATTGTIPFYQAATTQLSVGELQVLNR